MMTLVLFCDSFLMFMISKHLPDFNNLSHEQQQEGQGIMVILCHNLQNIQHTVYQYNYFHVINIDVFPNLMGHSRMRSTDINQHLLTNGNSTMHVQVKIQ